MKRINTGLLLSAPAQARPAIVERLAELNTQGTEKDHGGPAFNSRTLRQLPFGYAARALIETLEIAGIR